MKTLLIYLLSVLTISSTFASSKIEQGTLEKIIENEIHKRLNSSLISRESKNYEILSGVGVDSRGTFIQVTGGKYLNDSAILELSLSKFNDVDYEGAYVQSTKGSLYRIDLGIKKFASNSFYAKGGIGYTRGKAESTLYRWSYDYYGNFSDYSETKKTEYSALSFEGEIGNQWQWDSFTLGVSWIGYSSMALNLSGGNQNDSLDLINSKGALRLLNLQLGMSF
ncbi:putative exported protein [Halobacteriovorax marinus SJ]|uniref:Exported protein n=1 Tax=Halobacteriovorax marinus (strain ATCC BAA-682 / DSM 15412 / SJ) TaxID=862908 RepID=E1X4B2_HALMS|nr:hypothetical protein [Halobacteriovorax marinus]CBW27084.1 putative exported protein [Halobacteriovorax marinus SJ]